MTVEKKPHPAGLVDLFLMVQDSVLPGKVEELQDNGQPSEQEFLEVGFALDEIWRMNFVDLKPFRMEDKLLVIDDHAPVSSNLFALGVHIFNLHHARFEN